MNSRPRASGIRADKYPARVSPFTPRSLTPLTPVPAWLQPLLSSSSPVVATRSVNSEQRCACSGNCRTRHLKGACAREVVKNGKFCRLCECVVAGCACPQLRSDFFCSHHRRVVEGVPFGVKLAVAAAPVAEYMMPCDVDDFPSRSGTVQNDLAMLIFLTAAIQEPYLVGALVEAWQKLPPQYNKGSELRVAILKAVTAASEAHHSVQLAQLPRQGVGRFFGLIAIASNLGLITRTKKKKAAAPMSKAAGAPAQRAFLLGSGKIEYAELDPSRCKCATFLAACRAEELALATPPEAGGASTARGGTMGDLIDYGVRRVTDALQRIGCKSGALPFSDPDADGYCIDWLRRKLVAARVQQQGLHTCDWGAVDKATLSSMCADARSNLASIYS